MSERVGSALSREYDQCETPFMVGLSAVKKNNLSQECNLMSAPAPWHLLRSKPKEQEEVREFASDSVWKCPPYIQLDRHVKFYRDLVKSTEKVELTLSHSGKTEVTVCGDSPAEPDIKHELRSRETNVILVPIRGDNDRRLPFIEGGGRVDTRPEFKDRENLVRILLTRRQQMTPHGSKSATPSSSPKQTETGPGESMLLKRPPPPAGPPGQRPPPPPKAPPAAPPEKRLRL